MRSLPAALGLVALLCGCGGGDRFPRPPEGMLTSADAIQRGKALYQRDCSTCHGPSAHGDGPQARGLNPSPSDLRNLTGGRADRGYWFLRIKQGGKDGPLPRPGSAMPAWGAHLSDDEIWNLVAYLNSLAGARS